MDVIAGSGFLIVCEEEGEEDEGEEGTVREGDWLVATPSTTSTAVSKLSSPTVSKAVLYEDEVEYIALGHKETSSKIDLKHRHNFNNSQNTNSLYNIKSHSGSGQMPSPWTAGLGVSPSRINTPGLSHTSHRQLVCA